MRNVSLAKVMGRGLRMRCPRCGEGKLFRRGIRTFEKCSECGLRYQRDNGDTWMFTIITDRIPILFGVAVVYFGFRPEGVLPMAALFAALAIPILATLRRRQGLAIALVYLSRLYFPDPSDDVGPRVARF